MNFFEEQTPFLNSPFAQSGNALLSSSELIMHYFSNVPEKRIGNLSLYDESGGEVTEDISNLFVELNGIPGFQPDEDYSVMRIRTFVATKDKIRELYRKSAEPAPDEVLVFLTRELSTLQNPGKGDIYIRLHPQTRKRLVRLVEKYRPAVNQVAVNFTYDKDLVLSLVKSSKMEDAEAGLLKKLYRGLLFILRYVMHGIPKLIGLFILKPVGEFIQKQLEIPERIWNMDDESYAFPGLKESMYVQKDTLRSMLLFNENAVQELGAGLVSMLEAGLERFALKNLLPEGWGMERAQEIKRIVSYMLDYNREAEKAIDSLYEKYDAGALFQKVFGFYVSALCGTWNSLKDVLGDMLLGVSFLLELGFDNSEDFDPIRFYEKILHFIANMNIAGFFKALVLSVEEALNELFGNGEVMELNTDKIGYFMAYAGIAVGEMFLPGGYEAALAQKMSQAATTVPGGLANLFKMV